MAEPRESASAAVRDHLREEAGLVLRGRRLRDRLRIMRMLLYLHAREGRLGGLTGNLPRRRPRELDLALKGGPYLRLRTNDVVLAYIFGLGEYEVDFEPLGRVRSLLDLGANIGLATTYLASRLELERMVCVEPDPENFKLLEKNLARNVPAARPINAAVVAEPGRFRLEPGHPPGEIRVVPGEGTVEAKTISELLDQARLKRVDLMKIDIEGGEIPILERPEEWAGRVGAILGEVHSPLTVERAGEQLRAHGFEPLEVPDRPFFRDILYLRRSR